MSKKTVLPAIPPEFNRTALLVVDVQLGLFQKATPIYKAEELLHNINLLIEHARDGGVPVVYIQHSDPRNLVKDSPGWQLHPRLHPPEHDPVVHKLHGNAFEGTELAGLLDERRVGRLVVTGLVTHGCVRATCLGGRELGYPVTLISDAHSNYSPDAAALIAKWHENLAQAGVLLQPTAEVLFDHQPVEN
jgi:nicotinamidase-related amidase